VVGAEDSRGLGAAQGFTLTVRENHAPVVATTVNETAIAGTVYRYDVMARDADGDKLSYSIDAAAQAKGIAIDSLGRISWIPKTADITTTPLPVIVTVKDAMGAIATETINLSVTADTEAPKVSLTASNTAIAAGSPVTFQVAATDNIGLSSLQLKVNGETYAIDADGLATVTVKPAWTTVTAEAIATDTAGNQTSTATNVTVVPLRKRVRIT
jgi:large repetitive protein